MNHHTRTPGNTTRNRLGFTLVEMLTVLVVIALLAALVIPGQAGRETERLRAAARTLAADARFAQVWSIGNGADPAVLTFDTDVPSYRVARRSDPATPITDPVTGVTYERVFGSGEASAFQGITLGTLKLGGDNTLSYSARGFIDQSDNASIDLVDGTAILTVAIDSETGMPTIE